MAKDLTKGNPAKLCGFCSSADVGITVSAVV